MNKNLYITKKALIITDVTAPGGVDTYIIDMVRFAKSDGWEVSVLMDMLEGSDKLYESLIRENICVIRKRLYHRENTDKEIESVTVEILTNIDPDIVHVVCGSPRSAIIPRKVVKELGFPLFFTEQYVDPNLEFTPLQYEQIKDIYTKADGIIVVCEENKRLLNEKYLLKSQRITVIPNSILIKEKFNRKQLEKRDFYNALCIGRLTPQKGIDVLIKGVFCMDRKIREQLKITIIGDGAENKLLNNMICELGLETQFEFLGWIPDAAMLIGMYDLFILPSRFEGQPFALLEAMSCGLPCIASEVSGIPELFSSGENGTFIESENPKSISNVLTEFINDPSPFVNKTSIALDYIRENHNLITNMERLLRMWDPFIDWRLNL